MLLKNKTIFITGATSGIGLACAKSFAHEGANLIVCARHKEKLAMVAQGLREAHHGEVHELVLDVSNLDAVRESIKGLPIHLQHIDVLINNAGLAQGIDKIYEANTEDWDKMIDVNIKGLLYVTRYVLEGMVKRHMGHVVNIGSISGYMVYPGGGVYCATKFAVRALTQGIKMDVHGTPIRVTEIDPGMVETNYSVTRFKGDEKKAEAVYQGMTPLTPEDIAESVLFCITRRPHVNIAQLMLLPVDQTHAFMVRRD